MKNNEEAGFDPIHVGEFSGDAGGSHTANVTVGIRDDEHRACATIWYHDQDISREGVQDCIAGRGKSPDAALAALLLIPHGWDDEWTAGLARAVAEARDEIDD